MKTKKLFLLSILAIGALIAVVPALADDHDEGAAEGDEKKFHIHGEIRARGEYTENYFDFSDTTDDEFGFYPYRVRIAADGQLADNVRGYVEFQGAGHFGNENPFKNSSFPPDQGFEEDVFGGIGDQDDVNLYQGFLELQKVAGSNFSIRIGRQEHTYGTELLLGDNDFYNGTSFDGARGWWGSEQYDVSLLYYKVFEGNQLQGCGFIGCGVTAGSADQNLFGGTLDWRLSEGLGNIGAYILRAQLLDIDSAFWTVGGRYARMPSKEKPFDWNIELALQNGEDNSGGPGTTVDLKGNIVEGWFGYSFGGGARHRVHIGGLISSGDDGTDPTDNETFIPLFGDDHAYNRTGDTDFFSLGDLTDWNVGYDVTTASEKHQFGASLHKFMTSEDVIIGPGLTEDDLGSEWDLWYGFKYADNTKLTVGAANLALGDLFGPTADDILRVYGQVRVRW